ncbi:Ribonuclease h domain [Thalictrum thalictroides]|uniref:Ribonuclease h domain n=1 Tax=Thalictrum thalictroides TaxID=46969 RepID=A0A7J6UT29_THATH|nr:Ribonuclease h domain [Thalictrum thalictroides]
MLPKTVAKQLSQLCAKFLWSGPGLENKMHHSNLRKLELKKECGGLGLRNFMASNEAAYQGLVFNIACRKPTLGVKWIWTSKIKSKGFWTMTIPNDVSWVWRAVLKTRELARKNIKFLIANGIRH